MNMFPYLIFFFERSVPLPYLNTLVGSMDHTIIRMLPFSRLFLWLNSPSLVTVYTTTIPTRLDIESTQLV